MTPEQQHIACTNEVVRKKELLVGVQQALDRHTQALDKHTCQRQLFEKAVEQGTQSLGRAALQLKKLEASMGVKPRFSTLT